MRKAATAAGFLAGMAFLLIPLIYSPWSAETRLGRRLLDFTHTPVFAAVFLLLLGLSTLLLGSRLRHRWAHYALAATVALATGVLSEVAQHFLNRDADAVDVLRDCAGVAAALLVSGTLDRRLAQEIGFLARPLGRRYVLTAAALALLLAFAPVVLSVWAYRERDEALPLLRGFDSPWERPFLDLAHTDVEVGPPPAGWDRRKDDLVGRVTFSRVQWPAVRFEECYPDWTSYESLALDFYSESPDTHKLGLSVEDEDYADNRAQFSRRFDVAPGASTIRIPLADIRSGPATGELDLSRVKNVILFAVQPPEPFTIWVDDLRLEGAAPAPSDWRRAGTSAPTAAQAPLER